jgi:hypothetical protein
VVRLSVDRLVIVRLCRWKNKWLTRTRSVVCPTREYNDPVRCRKSNDWSRATARSRTTGAERLSGW